MKILLTGAGGQLGRELQMLTSLPIQWLSFSKAELDIRNVEQLMMQVLRHQPDLIINAAAYTAVDQAEQEQALAFSVNRDGVKNLALVCREHDLPLIHLSTDYVFDGNKETAYVEDDLRLPLNVYGASKAEGEKFLQDNWEKHIILRTSWVFGQHGKNFVKTILRLAAQQDELCIVSDQRGFPTAARDLANTLLVLAEQVLHKQPQWGVFHYRGDKALSWFDFANTIVQHEKKSRNLRCQKIHPVTSERFSLPAKRPKNALLDMGKIQNRYGISPGDWERGLVDMLKDIAS